MKATITALLLLAALPTLSQPRDWEDESVVSRQRLAARAAFIPYATQPGDRQMSLDGRWQFRWSPTPEGIEQAAWGTITVPACWEAMGFGTPIYSSSGYTFKIRPPFVTDEPKAGYTTVRERNPTGEYRRTFTLPAEWGAGHTVLRLDGVISCCAVTVNGHAAGYTQGSNHPAEFDITPYIIKGENLVTLLVRKYCDGSYLEDQDAWRFSGIHRSVTLFHVPPSVRLRDFAVRTPMERDSVFRLLINPTLESLDGSDAHGWTLSCTLRDAAGRTVATQSADAEALLDYRHKAAIMNEFTPQRGRRHFARLDTLLTGLSPWTAETPTLYTLTLALRDESGTVVEQARQRIGFRDVRIVGPQLLVNGRPIRLRGVNRVEHDPVTLKAVSRERMLQDITLMKRANINAVRTSHAPAAPYWYDLCDSLGLYVLDEADCEAHGLRGGLTSTPSWGAAMLDRAQRLSERDKNHASVILWSLGNESGFGANHAAMAAWLHEWDPTRPVHYEGAQGDAESHEPDPASVDIISRFYPRLQAEYLNPGIAEGSDKERAENARWERLLSIAQREWHWADGRLDQRPVLTSEYAHAMGNAMGNLQEYWDEIYSHPRMLGGFVWDWVDQGIIKDGHALYGGDFGDKPNLKAFCLNGVVKADRQLTAKYYELQHVYSPVQLTMHDGQVWATNRNHHVSLARYTATAAVTVNGRERKRVTVALPPVEPGDSAALTALTPLVARDWGKGDARLTVAVSAYSPLTRRTQGLTSPPRAHSADQKPRVSDSGNKSRSARRVSGESVAPLYRQQFALSGTVLDYNAAASSSKGNKSPRVRRVSGESGAALPAMRATVFRAPTDNDRSFGNWLAKDWQRCRLDSPTVVTLSSDTTAAGVVTRTEALRFLGGGTVTVSWRIEPQTDGSHNVTATFRCAGALPELPRLGVEILLPKEYSALRYYGRGPWDTYPDRWRSCHVGLYESTVAQEYAHFPVPQDCGTHDLTAAVTLSAGNRGVTVTALGVPFSFAALPYTASEIASVRHDHELPASAHTVLTIDCARLGLGNSSCGPGVLKRYAIDRTREHTLSFNIR